MSTPNQNQQNANSPHVTHISNGMAVVMDIIPHVQTVAMGVWCDVGARYETPEIAGISHFLEHMVFKGTKRRSALEISEEIESVGGSLNAYTSREVTGYHARLLSKDWKLGADILADITLNATFSQEEMERERGVILQEIGQTDDTPDDIIFDYFFETAFHHCPVGRPVLGNVNTVKSITPEQLHAYRSKHYVPQSMVFCVSGNFDPIALTHLLESTFGTIPKNAPVKPEPANYTGGVFQQSRPLEQSHVLVGFQGISVHDADYYAITILSSILGSGMSSRLFQEIREKRGLAYSVFSFTNCLEDKGVFGVYAGTSPEQTKELLNVIAQEINRLADTLTDAEIERAKNQLKASLLMGMESTVARCEHWAQSLLTYGEIRGEKDLISRIDTVHKSQLQKLAKKIFSSPTTLASIGPHSDTLTY